MARSLIGPIVAFLISEVVVSCTELFVPLARKMLNRNSTENYFKKMESPEPEVKRGHTMTVTCSYPNNSVDSALGHSIPD